ncbi:YfiR family protein [Desulfopila sp. IMCC35006]|uniref:YfiR family protein n=1 Tax=Desulfopila sp. IMCC35006 TaxID=2569542 RepID=UPI0010AC3304|nr:YfiR family protein [Desulfopila sp. IMCC35006]TKB25514.1 YfiR family protein [Desulfopila sp. IMCC35006]
MTSRKLFISVLPVILALLYGVAAIAANTETEGLEYKLKAAFLLNFSKFTTWPKEAFSEAGQTFDFCIIGKDPFGKALDGLESKKVGGRNVRLHHAGSTADAKTCHVMFISKSEQSHLAQLLQAVVGRPVLTVSDIEGFSRQGGILEFVTKDGRLSFVANNQQALHSGLQINASLLNLAAEVF